MTNTITLSKHNSLNTQMYKHANKKTIKYTKLTLYMAQGNQKNGSL